MIITRVASRSEFEVRPDSGVPLVAAFTGDALAALDRAADSGLHGAYHTLRHRERVTWPCPCAGCVMFRRLNPPAEAEEV